MPERRLSRLLRTKLLRRSSVPAGPKPGNGADPRVHPNSTSQPSGPPQLLDSTSEKTPFSAVSSAHSSDEVGPALGSRERRRLKSRRTEPRLSTSRRDPVDSGHTSEHRPLTPPPTDPNGSLVHTPLTDEFSTLEYPLPTPQQSDDASLQSTHVKVRSAAPPEPSPLTPALDTVVEGSSGGQHPGSFFPPASSKRPSLASRRQSLLPASHQHLISGLLENNPFSSRTDLGSGTVPAAAANMVQRKVWVKRPGGSATLVPYTEDAMVDELRDQVIMKYGNSLGRTFDSPDILIRIVAREGSTRHSCPERLLSPEEVLSSVIDTYYPGGQMINEALVIDAPSRRTPKPSPRIIHHHHSEPGEHGDYFPLMPTNPKVPTPPTHSSSSGGTNAPSISILSTGQAPPIPSPGGRRPHHRRPPLTRHTTNSPTMLGQPPTLTGMMEACYEPEFILILLQKPACLLTRLPLHPRLKTYQRLLRLQLNHRKSITTLHQRP